MPHPKDRKQRTRQKILEAAARLFRARGFGATSIEDVMLECGLTRGGFYAHFHSKAQLYQEAVTDAGGPARPPQTGREVPTDWLDDLFMACRHGLDTIEQPHPVWALLATDVASGIPQVRQAYARALQAVRDQLRLEIGSTQSRDETALAAATMLAGALAAAATIDDTAMRNALADACQRATQALRHGDAASAAGEPVFLWAPDADMSLNIWSARVASRACFSPPPDC